MTNFNASSFRFFERKVAQGIALSDFSGSLLYHTKNYQGTTTKGNALVTVVPIIPYQELPGNYNAILALSGAMAIIPYQELPGNYNWNRPLVHVNGDYTIPRTTRELQLETVNRNRELYYTIPRTTRELQLESPAGTRQRYYTIPRTTRELQLSHSLHRARVNYTIPRTTRELQPLRYGGE